MSKKKSDWEEYALGSLGVSTGDIVNQQGIYDKQIKDAEEAKRAAEARRASEKKPQSSGCLVCGDSTSIQMFVLHAGPVNMTAAGIAWYYQVVGDARYVRFNPGGVYLDRGGLGSSSAGCENKSIAQLRKENRTYQLVRH